MSTESGTRDYGRFDELAEEFAERFRRGERPSIQEYVDLLPEMAEEIREMFPALVEVERADGDVRDEASPPPEHSKLRFRQIGDYRILREVGRGGMGVVYEAEQVSLGRRVALKVLPGHVVGDRKTQERFLREAKSAARLHHTNIVPVYEVGRDGDVSFYAMQLIQGQGLEQVIDELTRLRQARPKRDAYGVEDSDRREPISTDVLTQADASARVRKRDLGKAAESLLTGRFLSEGQESSAAMAKASSDMRVTERIDSDSRRSDTVTIGDQSLPAPPPSNLSNSAVLPGGTHVSEIDASGRRQPFFRSVAQIGRQAAQGLAYAHARGIVHRDIKPSNLLLDTAGVVWITDFGLAKAEDDGLTATGDILGTLRYMPPERFRGEGDSRADIYGLGVTLYELLTLRPAFGSSDRLKLIEKVKNEEPARPRSLDARIPRDLETIVLKAIDKDPQRRYQTADALAEDLRRYLADEPIKARQTSASERYWRWARRNPAIATLGGVLTATLIAISVGSIVAASYFETIARNESFANQRSQIDRELAVKARRQAIEERDKSLQLSANLALEKAITLGEQGRADHGLLWMLEALERAPDDADAFRNAVRWNLGAWLGQVHKPLRISEPIGPIEKLGFSPDGKAYATGNTPRDRELATPIALWDTATGAKLKTLAGAFAPFVFRPDHKVLYAVAEPRGTLAIELDSDRVLWKRTELQGMYPYDLELTPDGSTVFVHRDDENDGMHFLHRLDATTGKSVGEPLQVLGLAAEAPSGETAAAVRSENGEVKIDLRHLPTGRVLFSWPTGGSDAHLGPNEFRFSPDGRSIFATILRGGILYQDDSRFSRIWETAHGQPISPIMPGTTYSIYTPAADRLLTLTNNLWLLRRADDSRGLGSGFNSGTSTGHSPMTHPDGLTVADALADGAVRLWQISPEAELVSEDRSNYREAIAGSRVDREQSPVSVLSNGFITDGRIAITVTKGLSGREQIRVSELATGRMLGKPSPHQSGWEIRGLTLSPDGRSFATGSDFGSRTVGEVRLWSATTGRLLLPPMLHTNYVVALAYRPDGKVLAAGDYNGYVRFWDTATGKEVGRPIPQGEIVVSLAFSSDGKVLAVGLADDKHEPGVRIWNAETHDRIFELLPSTETVRQIVFRPDGKALLAVHDHHTQLWDAVHGLAIGGPTTDETFGDFRPDGGAFLTLGRDGAVKLRNASTGKVLARLMTGASPAVCAAFRRDGGLVVAGFQDGSVRLCDPATSLPIGPPRFMEHSINKVAFGPNGASIAGVDTAGNSRTWPVPRPMLDKSLDDSRLRIEARTGLRMDAGRTIARLDTVAWRHRLEQLGRLDPAALQPNVDPVWHEPMAREAERNGQRLCRRLAPRQPDCRASR